MLQIMMEKELLYPRNFEFSPPGDPDVEGCGAGEDLEQEGEMVEEEEGRTKTKTMDSFRRGRRHWR